MKITLFQKILCLFGVALAAVSSLVQAEKPQSDPYANETEAQRDERMAWFREAKFGMFIHWGVYSVLAGEYHGEKIAGIGEWIMKRGSIPIAEYKEYAKEFNPTKYDPDLWVKMAKDAGMKYIVITSKHHDGFALFDSKVSEWDVVDATPYGKDLIAPLAAACKKYDMKLGLYYSQAQDWTQGGAAKPYWDDAQGRDMDAYIKNIAVPQVKEILSNYGPISVLWWDTPHEMTDERADQLLPLLKLQPNIIHNNRLRDTKSDIYGGDIKTPEQHIPGTGLAGDWESCMTMNNTWGFKSYDHNWKSSTTLIHNLADIASKGGNYLLNVGPTAEGLIPAPSVERLKDIGTWMKANSEAIYGTKASPCRTPEWGRITTKVVDGKTMLYLHVFDWPEDGELFLPIVNKVKSSHLLVDTARVFGTEVNELGITVRLTGSAPDAANSVVVLEIEGEPQVSEADKILQNADGTVELPAQKAIINNANGSHAVYEPGLKSITHWESPRASVDWTFTIKTPGTFRLLASVAAAESTPLKLSIGTQVMDIEIPASSDEGEFESFELGIFELDSPGEYTVHFEPVRKGWKPIKLGSVELVPVGD